MKLSHYLLPLSLALSLSAALFGPRTAHLEPGSRPAFTAALPREVNPGGFVLYQPFNHADGQVADGTHTHGEKQYKQTIERWVAVGFLRVEEADADPSRLEYWYLSKGDESSTATTPHVPFVEEYFWPGRSTPTADKHTYWSDLPIRFERRNDLSGAVDLAAFVTEVSATYGYDLSASGGKFERHDASAQLASGY